MPTAAKLRTEIEAALANRIPSALTPAPRTVRPVMATGIESVDELLEGGLPVGAITEVLGPECSGRTSFALSFLAQVTQAAKVCAWIDVSDVFDPESAAAAGVNLSRLLWVRCGMQPLFHAQPPKQHPASSLPGKYLAPQAVNKHSYGRDFKADPGNERTRPAPSIRGLQKQVAFVPRSFEPQLVRRSTATSSFSNTRQYQGAVSSKKPWSRMEQALQTTDLLLQGGGFSAIVLDMGSIAPEHVLRVPLTTWFRYRAAAELTQASILLLTQHPCAKSSAELLLRLQPGSARHDEATVFTGTEHRLEVKRQRFTPTPTNVVPLRKSPQSVTTADWTSNAAWTAPR